MKTNPCLELLLAVTTMAGTASSVPRNDQYFWWVAAFAAALDSLLSSFNCIHCKPVPVMVSLRPGYGAAQVSGHFITELVVKTLH